MGKGEELSFGASATTNKLLYRGAALNDSLGIVLGGKNVTRNGKNTKIQKAIDKYGGLRRLTNTSTNTNGPLWKIKKE